MSTEMSVLGPYHHFPSDIHSAWQEHLAKEMTTRYQTLNTNARKVVDDANTEIGDLQKQIEGGLPSPCIFYSANTM